MKHILSHKVFESSEIDDISSHIQIIKDVFQGIIDDNNIETAHANSGMSGGMFCYIDRSGYRDDGIVVLFHAAGREIIGKLSKIKDEIEVDLQRLESMGYKILQRYYSPYNSIDLSFQYEIDYSGA